jgi:CBS-domain-containing membrane protein
MVTVRERIFDREGFSAALYAPGIVSGNRALWASLGAAIAMMNVVAAAFISGHPLIFVPPLAASAFIAFAVPRVRLARPKNIIGGHFIAALAANLVLGFFVLVNIPLGEGGPTSIGRILAVGLAVALGLLFMVLTDMDQPPALATAAVVAIGYSVPNWWVPATFAAGAAIVAFWAIVWNRIFFDYPPR